MKINNAKKEWITPELIVYGDIVSLTKGGTGWKTNGTDDDLVAEERVLDPSLPMVARVLLPLTA